MIRGAVLPWLAPDARAEALSLSAIPLVASGATALNSAVVLLCALGQSVGTLVDLFAFFRYQVSARVHTLLSRLLLIRQLLL